MREIVKIEGKCYGCKKLFFLPYQCVADPRVCGGEIPSRFEVGCMVEAVCKVGYSNFPLMMHLE
jgi:hypothetical protein